MAIGRFVAALAVLSVLGGCATAKPKPMPLAPVASFAPEAVTAQSLLNAYRKAHGRGAVALDPTLTKVAQDLATACTKVAKCDHNTGGSMGSRFAAAGFSNVIGAENLVRNQPNVEGAFAWWKGSRIHNDNMLKSGVTRMGFAKSPGHTAKSFWVLVVTSDP